MVEEYLKKLEDGQDFDEILLEDLEAEVPSELHECLMKSLQKKAQNKRGIPYKRFAVIAAGLMIMAFSVSLFASRIGLTTKYAKDNSNIFNIAAQSRTEDLKANEQEVPKSSALPKGNQMLSKDAAEVRAGGNEIFVLKTSNASVIDFLKRNAVYNEGTVYKLSREELSNLEKLMDEKSVIEGKYKSLGLKVQETYSYKPDELVIIELMEE